jgi:hypothetical protein
VAVDNPSARVVSSEANHGPSTGGEVDRVLVGQEAHSAQHKPDPDENDEQEEGQQEIEKEKEKKNKKKQIAECYTKPVVPFAVG